MPYELMWEPRGVVKTLIGVVDDDEFIKATEEIQNNSRFDNLRFVINDFSKVTAFEVSESCLEYASAMSRGARYHNDRIKIALVINNSTLLSNICNFSVSYPIPYPKKIFNSLADARLWCEEDG